MFPFCNSTRMCSQTFQTVDCTGCFRYADALLAKDRPEILINISDEDEVNDGSGTDSGMPIQRDGLSA